LIIFEAKTFPAFLQIHLKGLGAKGRGELRRISIATGIHTTTLSQAVKGARPFSPEQVAKICGFIGLGERETRFALLLLHHERAGTEQLRKLYEKELTEARKLSRQLSSHLKHEAALSEADKAIFYSDWYYLAIPVLSSIPGHQTVAALAERLGLSRARVTQAVEFLVRTGICVSRGGQIAPGVQSTHLAADSPLVSRHHGNWRIRALNRQPSLDSARELGYTSPMSLSKTDAAKVRARLVALVKEVNEIRDPSPCEEAYCLNIDWFRF